MFPIAPPTTWSDKMRFKLRFNELDIWLWIGANNRFETVLLPAMNAPNIPIKGDMKIKDVLGKIVKEFANTTGIDSYFPDRRISWTNASVKINAMKGRFVFSNEFLILIEMSFFFAFRNTAVNIQVIKK